MKQINLLSLLAAALWVAALSGAQTVTTERVSVSSGGAEGNNSSFAGHASWSISADGRFVVFHSFASNLVSDDSNGVRDVFVRDRLTGTTTRVSVDSSGIQGDGESGYGAISADGRFVAFLSGATNLVSDDTNGFFDYYVHDILTGVTTRVSVDSDGNQSDASSNNPAGISADGRYVAFPSPATNLVSGDTNGQSDAFVHDRQTGATTRVSVDSSGIQGNGWSDVPIISADGRFVVFCSEANNLVSNDTNGVQDAFVHDRQTGATSRVSVDSSGNEGNGVSQPWSISADGRIVTVSSVADNLVSGDTNGVQDAFVHDRQTGATSRVSVDSSGNEGNGDSYAASITGDGRFVTITSYADNLVSSDTNGVTDGFVHDRQTGITSRVSVDSSGNEGNGNSGAVSISADGCFVAIRSNADNLVGGDTNGFIDVFVRGPLFDCLFFDGFESGDTSAWSSTVP